jgi:pumilio homology domain family member 6
VYRGAATKQQKRALLREWFGPSVGLLVDEDASEREEKSAKGENEMTSDLKRILATHPQLRQPAMTHLKDMCNQLVQMKKTGFTMLHDALWEYWSNCPPSGPEEKEVMDWLRDDEDGDLVRNLAFTVSGSRLLCQAFARGDAKYRRGLLGAFKGHVRTLAGDANGVKVLVTVMECMDDTREVNKTVFKELLAKEIEDTEARSAELLSMTNHLIARVPLLWAFNEVVPKWLANDDISVTLVNEVREGRSQTSKKDPAKRRAELVDALSQPLLDFIAMGNNARQLASSGYGCQFLTEVLLNGVGEKGAALDAVASLARFEESDGLEEILLAPQAGRMLKTLVGGGHFDKKTRKMVPVEPRLKFHDRLYTAITADGEETERAVDWATGPNSFAVLAMLESEDFGHRDELEACLKGKKHVLLEKKAENMGARMILELLGENSSSGDGAVAGKKGKKKD